MYEGPPEEKERLPSFVRSFGSDAGMMNCMGSPPSSWSLAQVKQPCADSFGYGGAPGEPLVVCPLWQAAGGWPLWTPPSSLSLASPLKQTVADVFGFGGGSDDSSGAGSGQGVVFYSGEALAG